MFLVIDFEWSQEILYGVHWLDGHYDYLAIDEDYLDEVWLESDVSSCSDDDRNRSNNKREQWYGENLYEGYPRWE